MHDAPLGQLAHLGVVEDRLVEHLAVFHGPPHQLGVVDGRAVVAEGHGAGLHELPQFGQLLPLAILAYAGHDVDVALIGAGGLVLNELDGGLGIDRWLGVGDAGDRGESARDGGGRAGLDGFVLFAPGLAKVDVHVDQPGGDDLPRGVDDQLAAGGHGIVGGDMAVLHEQICDAIQPLAGIDHAAAFDQDRREWFHGNFLSVSRRARPPTLLLR